MKQKTKDLILEIERVQLIRKKCRTVIEFCEQCQVETNFVTLTEAASLFSVQTNNLLNFIQITACHSAENSAGEFLICVNSLLGNIKTRQNNGSLKMVEA
jgi:hypothetical protein